MAELLIGASILMTLILSIIELGFVHADEAGMRWLTHGIHTIPFMFIFTFVAMNITWALSLIGMTDNFMIDLGARVVIGIIAMIKIGAAASITGNGGVGEKKFHILIIGILVMASPYVWIYLLDGLIGQFMPF
ncbi:hypothetical protein COV13_00980 [Candidatus Woesearchaeota archaeon CG10_big_fil_rev_8_21_14_0_10_32_9]|nr:MAG: hypothetical protein COV13_00980 [Candidatus Woesearchaeota archaeon CG10_big_fil_rev_8_21_14_0_10_32_9]